MSVGLELEVVSAFASAPLKCISVNLTNRPRCDNFYAVDVQYIVFVLTTVCKDNIILTI